MCLHSFLVWLRPACKVLGSDGSCLWQGASSPRTARGPYWRGPWPNMPRRPAERLEMCLWVSAVTNGPPEVQVNQLASSACVIMALPPGWEGAVLGGTYDWRHSQCSADADTPSLKMMMMSWCLMSTDVIWHIRDKLWPMPKHGSIKATYVRCMRV